MPVAAILQRAEFGFLLGLAAFLPAVEAPKNICLGLFLICWLANRIRTGDWGGPWSRWDSLIVALIASGYLAAAFGGIPGKSLSPGNDILSYGLAFMAVRRTRFEGRQLWWLLGTLAAATILTLGYGYWGLLVTQQRQTLGLHSVGHVNHSAIYMGIAFCVAFTAACAVRAALGVRVALWAAAGLLFLSLLVTAARGAVIPTVLFIVVWVFHLQAGRGRSPWKPLLAIVAVAVLGVIARPGIIEKTLEHVAKGHAGSYRPAMAKTAVLAAREFPLFGVGATQFGKIDLEMTREWQARKGRWFADEDLFFASHAHGLFSNTLGERGLVGLAALLAVLGAWGVMLKRSAPRGGGDALPQVLWGSALGAWIITVVGGLFNTTLHHEHAMITSLLIALWMSRLNPRPAER